MRNQSRRQNPVARRRQRGAALILVVVVIMVLTVLGMAMVAFTTTEERSATAYRDTLQVRAVAEAGVRIVQMMFAEPNDRTLVPLFAATSTPSGATPPAYDYYGTNDTEITNSLQAIGIYRTNRPFLVPALYSGNSNRLFSSPFGGTNGWAAAFGGTYSTDVSQDFFDLRFRRTDPSTNALIANNWLDSNVNNLLTTSSDWNLNSGIITEISFYRPPQAEGSQWGICTVRVTAEKRVNGELYARETIEAVIGDNNPRPAVLGNGNIVFMTQGGVMCGNGCEQIHANGNAQVGDISGGQDPMVTATGTISGGSGSTQPNSSSVVAPEINPWDLSYKPTAAGELAKYYLVTTRALDAEWTDGNPATPADKSGRPCGLGTGVLLSRCQDYNLEYAADGTEKPARAATDTPRMYKWDSTNNEWTAAGCTTGTNLNCGAGTPTFTATPADDLIVAGTGETNNIPFHPRRVPRANFQIDDKEDGATVLVNGMFQKHGAFNAIMTIVAVGSLRFHAETVWYPAMANRTMWVTGRDIDVQSNCCTPSNTCAVNLANNAAQSIVAAHEQIYSQSQTALAGIVIGENRVAFDTTVAGSAIDIQRGDHAYSCGLPDWPWEMPTKPIIFSMNSASN